MLSVCGWFWGGQGLLREVKGGQAAKQAAVTDEVSGKAITFV